jgi:hypothetical protein
LSTPSFLPKLVDVAAREIFEPRFPNVPTEIDHWMRIIDDSISARLFGGAALQASTSSTLSSDETTSIPTPTQDVDFSSSASVRDRSVRHPTLGPLIDPRRDFDLVSILINFFSL